MGKATEVILTCYGIWFVGLILLAGLGHDVPMLYLVAPMLVPLVLVGLISAIDLIIQNLHHR